MAWLTASVGQPGRGRPMSTSTWDAWVALARAGSNADRSSAVPPSATYSAHRQRRRARARSSRSRPGDCLLAAGGDVRSRPTRRASAVAERPASLRLAATARGPARRVNRSPVGAVAALGGFVVVRAGHRHGVEGRRPAAESPTGGGVSGRRTVAPAGFALERRRGSRADGDHDERRERPHADTSASTMAIGAARRRRHDGGPRVPVLAHLGAGQVTDRSTRSLAQAAGIEGWLTDGQARLLWDSARALRPGDQRRRDRQLSRAARPSCSRRRGPRGRRLTAIDPHAGTDRGPAGDRGQGARGRGRQPVFERNLAEAGVSDRVTYMRRWSQEALGEHRRARSTCSTSTAPTATGPARRRHPSGTGRRVVPGRHAADPRLVQLGRRHRRHPHGR